MATCESLEAELGRLRTEASGLKNRIAALEAANKNNKNNNSNNSKTGNNNSYDDSEIKTRLKKVEDNQSYFTETIVELIDDFGYVIESLKEIIPIFDFLINIFTAVFSIFRG